MNYLHTTPSNELSTANQAYQKALKGLKNVYQSSRPITPKTLSDFLCEPTVLSDEMMLDTGLFHAFKRDKPVSTTQRIQMLRQKFSLGRVPGISLYSQPEEIGEMGHYTFYGVGKFDVAGQVMKLHFEKNDELNQVAPMRVCLSNNQLPGLVDQNKVEMQYYKGHGRVYHNKTHLPTKQLNPLIYNLVIIAASSEVAQGLAYLEEGALCNLSGEILNLKRSAGIRNEYLYSALPNIKDSQSAWFTVLLVNQITL